MKLTKRHARKVLEVIDAGLCSGLGIPEPGFMCVEAAVCYGLGLPHGDNPECVSPAVRSLKITLNDCAWSSNAARARGLRRLGIAQLGTDALIDDVEFAKRVSEIAIRRTVPAAMRHAASVNRSQSRRDALEAAAVACEKEGTEAAARAAARAAAEAADRAARAAAWAAWAADRAARAAARAAAGAAWAAARAAAGAARAAAGAAAEAAAEGAAEGADEELSVFAELVVGLLIEMKAPGCRWLDITTIHN